MVMIKHSMLKKLKKSSDPLLGEAEKSKLRNPEIISHVLYVSTVNVEQSSQELKVIYRSKIHNTHTHKVTKHTEIKR